MTDMARFCAKLAIMMVAEYPNMPWMIHSREDDYVEIQVYDDSTGPIPGYAWHKEAIHTFVDMADVVIREAFDHINSAIVKSD